MGRAGEVAGRLGLVLAGMLAALVVSEVAVRALHLQKTEFFCWAPHRGWGLKPGAAGWQDHEGVAWVSINSAGFRGPERSLEKPPGTLQIVTLGDSFTEGEQVPYEQTWSVVLERGLARRIAAGDCGAGCARAIRRVEVLNMGVNGYGTPQELWTLRDQGWQFSPDIVVLAVFTGNDMRNNSVNLEPNKCRPFYVYRRGELMPGGPFFDSQWFWFHCMARYETRHSQLLNLLGDSKSAIRARIRKWVSGRAGKPKGEAGLSDVIYQPPVNEVWRDAWRVTEGDIELVQQETARHGVPLLVVTMANGIQDHPSPTYRAAYMEWVGGTDIFYPDHRIAALGERDGFPVLNVAPPLQQYAEAHHIFLHGFKNTTPGVGHWNALGHKLTGEVIAQKICELIRTAPGWTIPRAGHTQVLNEKPARDEARGN